MILDLKCDWDFGSSWNKCAARDPEQRQRETEDCGRSDMSDFHPQPTTHTVPMATNAAAGGGGAAPAIKLIYFDFGGRAESIRLALHVGGVPFEDVRITEEEFRSYKAGA